MGISVISGSTPITAGGTGTALPADSGPGGFAALITDLLGMQTPLLGALADSASGFLSGQNARTEDERPADDGTPGTGIEGFLPLLMGTAPPLPPTPHPAAAGSDPQGAASLSDAGTAVSNGFAAGLAGNGEGALPSASALAAGGGAEVLADAATIAADSSHPATTDHGFAAALAAQNGTSAAAAARTEVAAEVATPLRDAGWAQDFGSKVVWLARAGQQTAELSINPPQLGPVHVTINLNGDQAAAIFASPHAEVRQAIQDAMPQLREMLSSAGINLGQANVGSQMPQQDKPDPQRFANEPRSSGDNAILRSDSGPDKAARIGTVRHGRGMVDLFA